MYAGTKVNWHEVLMPDSLPTAVDESLPLFLCAFSADKGSEDIKEFTSYSEFKNMYGDKPNFFKYGQPLLQAHAIMSAGGRIMGKRIVANDSTIANTIISVQVTSEEEQKKNSEGKPLYLDENGNETTEVTETPLTFKFAKLKYTTSSVSSKKTFDEVKEDAIDSAPDGVYPLFVVCDNGRGVSNKKVRITPDYEVSRKSDYMIYKISDIEGAYVKESVRFTLYPEANTIANGVRKSMLLINDPMNQLKVELLDDIKDEFINKLSEITGYEVDDLYTFDILFGKTTKGSKIPVIVIDDKSSDAVDIASDYGIILENGSDGEFLNPPFAGTKASDEWTAAAVEFFSGKFSDEIYDLDQHKIDFCVDANYPDEVKKAIADLADFREDFYYLRDLGTEINSINDVTTKIEEGWPLSPFVGDYCSTYDIIDPFSYKQIKVTMTYGMAPILVSHFSKNASAPLAGEYNNFVITNAIPNTLNIIPRVIPNPDDIRNPIDQKQTLDDLHVNFLNLSSDINTLAVQSTYTSQNHNGPLSYAGNVIITQMMIKAIRRYCPKIRFMLMDPSTTDFSRYKMLIDENVINKYSPYFKSVELVYTRDDEMISNKIFNASLLCYYRDFPMGEIFDVFAIEGSPSTNPVSL